MRILIAIPHYFGAGPEGFPSESTKPAAKRVRQNALAMVLTGLHQHFGADRYGLDHGAARVVRAASPATHHLDIIVCTAGKSHLLGELPALRPLYTHIEREVDPLLLGFECHKLLAERRGQYDYYAYVEDDVLVSDPSFFAKRRVFDKLFGPHALLQPNRYEASLTGPARKLYVDYHLGEHVTKPHQDLNDTPSLAMPYLDEIIRFERTTYPSAGSFFLNATQLAFWADGPFFLDGDHSYLSVLDAAATLSVMKSFRIYKPVLEQAWFLEVSHVSPRWIEDVNARMGKAAEQPERRRA